MSREMLHAWVCGEYVGHFERDFELDRPRFVRDSSSNSILSFSIRTDSVEGDLAPGRYLDNLLPDRSNARAHIQQATGARSARSWDLLSAIGGDLPGGIVLHAHKGGPAEEEPFTRVAGDDVIASRIVDIKMGGSGVGPAPGQKPRFSLAGAQSKFALAQAGDVNFWSDSATPSTHILKPESREHDGLERVEAATLQLANFAGVKAPKAIQASYSGESSFRIDRFDRSTDQDGITSRIHAEDMLQVLGLHPSDKYSVNAEDVARKLREVTGSDELGLQFYRQFAFNVLIGNADAHAKNYTVLHLPAGAELSPLYDAIPVSLFPDYSSDLAMPVGWTDQFTLVTADDWIESAQLSGLDPDAVMEIVRDVAAGVSDHLDSTLGTVDHKRVSAASLDPIRMACERQVAPARARPSNFSVSNVTHSGQVVRRGDVELAESGCSPKPGEGEAGLTSRTP